MAIVQQLNNPYQRTTNIIVFFFLQYNYNNTLSYLNPLELRSLQVCVSTFGFTIIADVTPTTKVVLGGAPMRSTRERVALLYLA
jgi:hypothetical protein